MLGGRTKKDLEHEHLHIVRFFDEHDSWCVVASADSDVLG